MRCLECDKLIRVSGMPENGKTICWFFSYKVIENRFFMSLYCQNITKNSININFYQNEKGISKRVLHSVVEWYLSGFEMVLRTVRLQTRR